MLLLPSFGPDVAPVTSFHVLCWLLGCCHDPLWGPQVCCLLLACCMSAVHLPQPASHLNGLCVDGRLLRHKVHAPFTLLLLCSAKQEAAAALE